MRKLIKPCLVGLLNVLLTVTLSVAVAEKPVGPPEPVSIRMQANPLAANTAPTFVTKGKVITDFGSSDIGYSTVIQADGKILVAGSSGGDLAVIRYLPNGNLDINFGIGGKAVASFGLWTTSAGNSMALQADGKILVAGTANIDGYSEFALVRYLSNGSLDSSFGNGGKVTTKIGSYHEIGNSVALQTDGKILVAGATWHDDFNTDFAMARYLSNGSLDISFGNGGKVATSFDIQESCWISRDIAYTVALQDDMNIVVAGSSCDLGFSVARYLPNGDLDTNFGNGGKVATNIGFGGYGKSAAIQSDGKILVAGNSEGDFASDFAVVRYLLNGNLDTNFGSGGKVRVDFDSDYRFPAFDFGNSVALQSDGKIIVAGSSTVEYDGNFAMARLLSDGSLDNSFGSGGKLITSFGGRESANGVDLQADGKIVLAGVSSDNSVIKSDNFALARYMPDGSFDTSFGNEFDSLGFQYSTIEQVPIRMGPGSEIFDAELAALATYDGATLTLTRQGGANFEDVFSSTGSLTTLTSGSYFAVNSVTVGRVMNNSGGTLQLRFMGANATQARVDRAMQLIAYKNASDQPPAQVLIDWTFDDGNTGAQGTGGALNTTGTVTVNISPRNDSPQLVKSPPPQTAVAKVAFSYTLPADTFTDPDGDPLTWNLSMADGTGMPPWLNFNPATRELSGTPTEFDIGALNLRVTVTDLDTARASADFSLQVVPGVLMGLAAQGYVGTDNQVQFGAFTITGAARKVLIRGLGPALNGYVPGFITDPKIALSLNGAPTPLEVNDDWEDAGNVDEIMALKHQPKNPTESVILRTLEPGVYNVHLSGSGGSTGIGMFQVYAVEGGGNGELKGLAAQGQVGTGNQVQFGAFTITGAARKVLIRGLGPALNGYVPGFITDPKIALSLNGAPTPLEVNDDWADADNADEIAALNHQPKNAKESAILRTLEPGVYNVHLSGSGGTEGIGMFQVYTVE